MSLNQRRFAILAALALVLSAGQSFAAEPVNYDDPNLARDSDFVGDAADVCVSETDANSLQTCLKKKRNTRDLNKAVKVLVDNSNASDKKTTEAAR
ncbi:MAG TPA: hypothetical protein VM432_01960 [Bdellovibrionales bacterium]|nr:hypothetical protein [Bdellovibrionales bacterium]